MVRTFIGLDNFRDALANPELIAGFGRVILFGSIQIPFMIGGALALALLIDSYLIRRGTVFRLGYFLPYAIPGVVAALVWTYIYSPRISPINQILESVGLGGISFSRPGRSCGPWPVPLVRNATLLTVLLSIIGTIQLFNEPTVLATQNPWMGASYTPMMMAYGSMTGQVSPSGGGPASAISLIMALVAATIAIIYALIQRRVAR